MKMKVIKARSGMPSQPPSGNDGLRLSSRSLTWEPAMSTGMTAMMGTKRM